MELNCMFELLKLADHLLNEGGTVKDYFIHDNNTVTILVDDGEEIKDYFFYLIRKGD